MYNETKDQWESCLADVEPTVLPDNPGDTLRAGSTYIMQENISVNDGTVVDVNILKNVLYLSKWLSSHQ